MAGVFMNCGAKRDTAAATVPTSTASAGRHSTRVTARNAIGNDRWQRSRERGWLYAINKVTKEIEILVRHD